MVTRVVNWNIAKRHAPWRELVGFGADVALLQEAGDMPEDVADRDDVGPGRSVDVGPDDHWDAHVWNSRWHDRRTHERFDNLYDRWAKVVKLSDRVGVEWFRQVSPIGWVLDDEIAVSGIGTVAAARVRPSHGLPFIVVSMYARWVSPHPSTHSKWGVGYSDGSSHRVISDLSAFIGSTDPSTHRIIAAGDLNTFFGATDNNRLVLAARDRTVFSRMGALGLEFLGPQAPDGGHQADPPPSGLPPDTRNVPTFRSNSKKPETARNQLDYVFASRGFHEQITVRALNSPDEWGPSDHCRILIDIEDD